MRHQMKTALWLLCCAVSLSACHSAQVQTRLVAMPPAAVPQTLLSPTEGPYRPAEGATQRDAALVIEDFIEALSACNADKASIAALLRDYESLLAAQRH